MASPQIVNDGSRLRLNTTIKLRWFAVDGANRHRACRLLRPPVSASPPSLSCAIAVSVALNAVLIARQSTAASPTLARHAALLLGYDILQLAALIFLTGGLENPFAILLVVPVAVSASTQPLPRDRCADGPRHRADDAPGKASPSAALGVGRPARAAAAYTSSGFGRRLSHASRSSRFTHGASGRRRAKCLRR